MTDAIPKMPAQVPASVMPASVMDDPALARVLAALAPHQALIVGGAVRNALLGEAVDDIDIATDARPADTTRLATTAGLKAIPTGADHGTITVVANGRAFEVTTFRRDVETDGRRAVVAFSNDLSEDAARRDFTINALYARPDGTVIDPIGGLPDLAARRLRFVGDPDARITEDYLRILRFFRFHARYGATGGADPAALATCARHADGLARISRERIGAEMRKLLGAPDPAEAALLMEDAGVLAVALPGARAGRLAALIDVEGDVAGAPKAGAVRPRTPEDISMMKMRWPLRLAALGADDAAGALRLSRDEARVQDELRFDGPFLEAAYRLGAVRAGQIAALRVARGASLPDGWRDEIAFAAAQRFPIAAADLMPQLQGPQVGRALRAAEAEWIASGFLMPAPALIDVALLAGEDR